jgi:hypothetical protein
MNGLEISKRFAREWLLPFIERELPDLGSHAAVGRFMGSDVLGADDDLSRDHNWGPTLEVYVDDDYAIGDGELVARLNGAAPAEFLGFRRPGGHDAAVTLRRTDAFIGSVFGVAPQHPRDWMPCAARLEEIESFLYFFRHGALFHDGSGRLTALRERYRFYPEDIHRLRLAACFYDIAHYGEYNFVRRLVERNDAIAMQIALGHFSKAVMRLHFYLDRDYAPYWKWLPHEFRKRGYSRSIDEELTALPGRAAADQAKSIQRVCDELRERLLRDGVFPSAIANPFNMPWFFRFRDEMVAAIADPEIRSLTY